MIENLHNIHFIGIGGAGMSAIAYVLLKRGYNVSGSDLNLSRMSRHLRDEGATVYIGHKKEQVENVDAVVVSTAIHQDNVELIAAKEKNIPVLHRSDVLADILNAENGVAVAGAHGKTTTSAMISCIAYESQTNPTVIIGGEVSTLGGNACNGNGKYVIAEADESDGSFLKFNSSLAIITNIENDHMDHYGSEENIYKAFKQFLANMKTGGKAILCIDNAKVQKLAGETEKEVITYAIENPQADYTARGITYDVNGTGYQLYYKNEFLTDVRLIVPGRHNVLNSLGAFAVAREMGIAAEDILRSLAKFGGAKRRFETKGKVNGVWVVDDYAHHPTEIKVTLQAAKQTRPQRLICIFQPHRYTRTQLLFNDFCNCFAECDEIILTDIYSAGEDKIEGISSKVLAEGVENALGKKVVYLPALEDVNNYLNGHVQNGDLVMTVGAGDVYKVGEKLVMEMEQ